MDIILPRARHAPASIWDPTAAEAARWVRSVSDDPKKSSERNYLVRRYSSVTTFSAKRSPRPFPIIFATFDPRFLAACPYLSRWPTSWSAIRSGRCSSLRTRVTRSGTRFLRQRSSDCSTRDYIWQLSKKPNLLPQQRAHPTVAPLIRQRANVADGRESEQPAPLIFLPPDTLTPQEIYLPEALATQGDAYVRWLAAEHHLPEQVGADPRL